MYEPESIFFRALIILKEKSEMWNNILNEKSTGERKMSLNR